MAGKPLRVTMHGILWSQVINLVWDFSYAGVDPPDWTALGTEFKTNLVDQIAGTEAVDISWFKVTMQRKGDFVASGSHVFTPKTGVHSSNNSQLPFMAVLYHLRTASANHRKRGRKFVPHPRFLPDKGFHHATVQTDAQTTATNIMNRYGMAATNPHGLRLVVANRAFSDWIDVVRIEIAPAVAVMRSRKIGHGV